MVYETNFMVRKSGKNTDCYYIDYSGSYALVDLAKLTGITSTILEDIYLCNRAVYDKELDVYYFPDAEAARQSIREIISKVNPEKLGKAVYLTHREIQYIRQALINEGVNTINLKNTIKENIFKKLNEA